MRRAILAVAIYLPLALVWKLTGLDSLCDRLMLDAAAWMRALVEHFPVGAETVTTVRHRNQALVIPFALACALAVRGLSPVARVARYASVAGAVVVAQVIGLMLQLGLDLALRFERSNEILLLTPWEQALSVRTIQLVYLIGVQVAPFLLLALTVFWSDPGERASRVTRRRALAASAVVIAVIFAAATTWHVVRESDDGHIAAHRFVARAFAARGQWGDAERQYRRVVRSVPGDGDAWSALATTVERQGRLSEADRIRARALDSVSDPRWRMRLADGD